MRDRPVPYWTKTAGIETGRHDLYVPLLEVKAADDGSGELEGFAAVFNTVDLGGDIILPGAFKKTLSDWKRAKGRIPLVDGHLSSSSQTLLGSVVRAEERTAGDPKGLWFRAKFSSDADSQTVRTKALEGHLNGVSIGYLPVPGGVTFKQGGDGEPVRVLSELKLFEISLTPVPMHPDARLTGVKAAIGSHSTATTDGAWDGAEQWKRLENDDAGLKGATAWKDPDGDPATKAAYRFIHHQVKGDGSVGAANVTACRTGIGVLNGGRSGTTIPDADRKGVYNHLAAHLRDAGAEPPELKTWMSFETFADELRTALDIGVPLARKAAVDALVAAYQNDASTPPAATADGSDTGTGAASTPDDGAASTSGSTTERADDDPRAYAYRFLRHPLDPSGPSDGAPTGQPVPPLADPLQVAQMQADRSNGNLDAFEAEVKQLLGR
jgi:HK97 family phage prohead protease